ncbi:hypothetical protein OEA41_007214 [Lepraria neglecta]|uniref:Uncharacterized protein n=1 Tax=Lepraria neglecta TaxID=209136 RepID=A0AAD9ZCS2_9LECA|nr:hypothetical protein OEA41_007214 [Lepraria neglecta]
MFQRFLLEDGNVTFAIGTKNGDVVNRNPGEVPLRKIFDFVTPAELERFENQDFIEEDDCEEQERLAKMLRKKAPGRPRKNPLFGDTIFREQSTLSSGLINSKRPHGRPRRNTVSAPSFNGPQPGLEVRIPTGLRTSSMVPDSESSGEIESTPRRQQYSMVAASGLAPPEISEEETSREVSMAGTQSPDVEPSSKRRKLESRAILQYLAPTSTPMVRIPLDVRPKAISHPAQISTQSRLVALTEDKTGSEEVDTIKPLSYDGPKDSSPMLGIDDGRLQSRDNEQNSPASSSSDSLIESIIVPRTQQSQSQPSQATQKQANSIDNLFSLKASPRSASDLSPFRNKAGDSTSSTQHTPPNKSRPRKVSLTPHFPHEMTYNHNSYSPTDIRPASSVSVETKNSSLPTQTQASPHERKRSPEPVESSNPMSKPSRTSVSSPLKPLQPTNYITKFFRPKSIPVKTPQLMEEEDDDESYDPIAHSSSPDNLSSEVLVVQRHAQGGSETNYSTAHTHDEPSKQFTTNQSEEVESDSEDDDNSVELELVSESIARARAASSTRKPLGDLEMQDAKSGDESKSDGKTGPGEDESSEEESNESDSLSSEALVVRRN